MQVRIEDQVAFADAARGVAKLLAGGPPTPVLAGAVLHAHDEGGVTLSGFDPDAATRLRLPADVQTPGRVLVSGRLLAEIARLLPRQTIEVTADRMRLTITAGGSRATLPLLPIEDYPQLPATPDLVGEIDAAAFAETVSRVAPAASTDPAMPHFTVVAIDLPAPGEPLRLYATDRYRMAAGLLPWQPALDTPVQPRRVLIPARQLHAAADLLAGGADTVRFGATPEPGRVGLTNGHRTITLAELAVKVPDYEPHLNPEVAGEVTVPVTELHAAVKRLALHKERSGAHLSLADNTLQLSIASDAGHSTETLAVDYQGEQVETCFNPTFLASALHALGTDLVHITIPTRPDARPWAFRPLTGTTPDDQLRYVVMPLKTAQASSAQAA
ncbi:DNA polymerase III subunit beta [Saccharopolyspora indica]|uniref:DNA polymerase III subunit beta n=1 Tax=Saccharopolyspora indica TaxID=1229659 RepID=UPI0022EB0A43|nr:DNA polymerase III subunit beta [Saccharopolyspora indica]MDA3644173.1 DNA polymerase III subunit beta [Saccharopolyspora indica]